MQIKITGELTISEIRQALFEKLSELEDSFAVRHARSITLYLIPTNGFGDEVVPRHKTGEELTKLYSQGPYRSAADEYKI